MYVRIYIYIYIYISNIYIYVCVYINISICGFIPRLNNGFWEGVSMVEVNLNPVIGFRLHHRCRGRLERGTGWHIWRVRIKLGVQSWWIFKAATGKITPSDGYWPGPKNCWFEIMLKLNNFVSSAAETWSKPNFHMATLPMDAWRSQRILKDLKRGPLLASPEHVVSNRMCFSTLEPPEAIPKFAIF